jgi:hypothetical protein
MALPEGIPYAGMPVITDWVAVDGDHHQRRSPGTAAVGTAQQPVEEGPEPEAEYVRHYRPQLEQLRTLRAQQKIRADLEDLQRADQLTTLELDLLHAALHGLPVNGIDESTCAEYAMAARLVDDLGRRRSQRKQQDILERYRRDKRAHRLLPVALLVLVYIVLVGVPTCCRIIFGDLSWSWLLLLTPVMAVAAAADALMRRFERAHPLPEPTPLQLKQFLERERQGMTLSRRVHG